MTKEAANGTVRLSHSLIGNDSTAAAASDAQALPLTCWNQLVKGSIRPWWENRDKTHKDATNDPRKQLVVPAHV